MTALNPVFLVGPTAVGKSEIALGLAERLGAEIISVDSMQVYRGLDLGTAKPNAEERRRVPHHLLDVAALQEPFDAAQFVRRADAAVKEIQARARIPLFCGGTGLYFKAWLEGLGVSPAPEPQLRAELEQTPLPALLKELAERDPATYERIDRQNPRRVIRAVEVIRQTGQPFSAQRAAWKHGEETRGPATRFGLSRSAADLRRRIDTRVEAMFAAGLVEETRRLLEAGLEQNRTAMQALGYRQVVEHLRGERSLEETVELIKIRTRQFAKRQMTWFRRQMDVQWLELAPGSPTADTAEELAARYRLLIG